MAPEGAKTGVIQQEEVESVPVATLTCHLSWQCCMKPQRFISRNSPCRMSCRKMLATHVRPIVYMSPFLRMSFLPKSVTRTYLLHMYKYLGTKPTRSYI